MIRKASTFSIIIVLMFAAYCIVPASGTPASKNSITVKYSQSPGPVNKKIFGSNIIAYDPNTYESWGRPFYGYADYAAGMWDPFYSKVVDGPAALARDAGISVLRFPGGCGVHHYDWKKTVDPAAHPHFLYNLDTFLTTCGNINAEPIITVSYFTGDEHDAADLVEYLNASDDDHNINGGMDWAHVRAVNGHAAPYGVKYFEIGNEDWHGDHQHIKGVTPEEYAARYLKYYAAMKAVDPLVRVGAILHDAAWNKKVLKAIGSHIDFGIAHMYFSGGWAGKDLGHVDAHKIFLAALAEPLHYEGQVQQYLNEMRASAGRDTPIAFTEYNTAFEQNTPVPYRHSLGSALVIAEWIKVMLAPKNDVLMANFWQFNNSFWGMIANGFEDDPKDLNKPYYKRPSYCVFEMYKQHFGDALLETDVTSTGYWIGGHETPYLSVNASKSVGGNNVYLIVINKNMYSSEHARINVEDFVPQVKGRAWVLNGSGVDATNEQDHDNVRVAQEEFTIDGKAFDFTFPPHSLTAFELNRK